MAAGEPSGLPPTTIINAEIDPLRSDGEMIAEKMKADGNEVIHKLYPGVTHEFFGMDAVVAKAGEVQDFAVSQLRNGTTGATVGMAPRKKLTDEKAHADANSCYNQKSPAKKRGFSLQNSEINALRRLSLCRAPSHRP